MNAALISEYVQAYPSPASPAAQQAFREFTKKVGQAKGACAVLGVQQKFHQQHHALSVNTDRVVRELRDMARQGVICLPGLPAAEDLYGHLREKPRYSDVPPKAAAAAAAVAAAAVASVKGFLFTLASIVAAPAAPASPQSPPRPQIRTLSRQGAVKATVLTPNRQHQAHHMSLSGDGLVVSTPATGESHRFPGLHVPEGSRLSFVQWGAQALQDNVCGSSAMRESLLSQRGAVERERDALAAEKWRLETRVAELEGQLVECQQSKEDLECRKCKQK